MLFSGRFPCLESGDRWPRRPALRHARRPAGYAALPGWAACHPAPAPAPVDDILDLVAQRDPDQKQFKNTVSEVLTSVVPLLEKHPEYKKHKILERMIEPDRVITFRVPWVDDNGDIQVNRGYRVQMSSVIGPYKGGLRFHPSVRSRSEERRVGKECRSRWSPYH